MLGSISARLEIPAFTKGKNQLPALEIEKTQLLQMLEYMLTKIFYFSTNNTHNIFRGFI